MKKITLITILLLASILCLSQQQPGTWGDQGYIRIAAPANQTFAYKIDPNAYNRKLFSSGTVYWDYTPYYPPPIGVWYDLIAIEKVEFPQISLCMPAVIVVGDIVRFDQHYYTVVRVQK